MILNNGGEKMELKPHNDDKIELTKPDKIIFGAGAAVYVILFFIEIYMGLDSEYSSSAAILAVGVFLISKFFQQRKTKQRILFKEKFIHASMLIVGIFLAVFSVISLFI